MKKLINFINQMAGLSNAMDNELFVADSNGKILFVNNPVADLSGYSVNELKKLQLKDIFDHKPFFKTKDLFKNDIIFQTELKLISKQGDRIHREAVLFKLPNPENDFPGFAVILKNDSPEHLNLIAELNKNTILNVYRHRKDAVWFSSDVVKKRTMVISDSIKKISGWTPEEFYAGTWFFFLSLIHPDELLYMIESHSKWLGQKNLVGRMVDHIPYHIFIRIRCRDNSYVRMDVEYIVQTRDENGVKLIFGSYRPLPENSQLTRDYIKQIDGKTFIEMSFLKNAQERSGNHSSDHQTLTAREKQVIQLLSDGHSSDAIAEKLHLSVHTVNAHRKQIMKKFGAKNLAELVKKYISAQ